MAGEQQSVEPPKFGDVYPLGVKQFETAVLSYVVSDSNQYIKKHDGTTGARSFRCQNVNDTAVQCQARFIGVPRKKDEGPGLRITEVCIKHCKLCRQKTAARAPFIPKPRKSADTSAITMVPEAEDRQQSIESTLTSLTLLEDKAKLESQDSTALSSSLGQSQYLPENRPPAPKTSTEPPLMADADHGRNTAAARAASTRPAEPLSISVHGRARLLSSTSRLERALAQELFPELAAHGIAQIAVAHHESPERAAPVQAEGPSCEVSPAATAQEPRFSTDWANADIPRGRVNNCAVPVAQADAISVPKPVLLPSRPPPTGNFVAIHNTDVADRVEKYGGSLRPTPPHARKVRQRTILTEDGELLCFSPKPASLTANQRKRKRMQAEYQASRADDTPRGPHDDTIPTDKRIRTWLTSASPSYIPYAEAEVPESLVHASTTIQAASVHAQADTATLATDMRRRLPTPAVSLADDQQAHGTVDPTHVIADAHPYQPAAAIQQQSASKITLLASLGCSQKVINLLAAFDVRTSQDLANRGVVKEDIPDLLRFISSIPLARRRATQNDELDEIEIWAAQRRMGEAF